MVSSSIWDRDYRRNSFRSHLLTARARGDAIRCTVGRSAKPDAAPPRQSFDTTRRIRLVTGSHLGSTLNPGGAVLTLGVFRRSRSVAYIHADASPSEVLCKDIVHPES